MDNEEELFRSLQRLGVKRYIVPATEAAKELGSVLYENAILLGFFSQLLGLPMPLSLDERNREAFMRGT